MIYTTTHIRQLTGWSAQRSRLWMTRYGEQPYGYGTGWVIDAKRARRLLG